MHRMINPQRAEIAHFGVKCGTVFLHYSKILRSIPKALRTDNPQVRDAILKRLRKRSGAAFGAALYRNLVHFGATQCDVDKFSLSFIL
jgi:hypothetical protein